MAVVDVKTSENDTLLPKAPIKHPKTIPKRLIMMLKWNKEITAESYEKYDGSKIIINHLTIRILK